MLDPDREVLGHAALEPVEDLLGVTVAQALVAHDDVRGQHRHARGDGPGMQVVDLLDVVDAKHVRAHLRQVQLPGSEVHEHRQGRAQQRHRPGQDEDGDEQGGHGVGLRPAGAGHDGGSDDDAH